MSDNYNGSMDETMKNGSFHYRSGDFLLEGSVSELLDDSLEVDFLRVQSSNYQGCDLPRDSESLRALADKLIEVANYMDSHNS